MENAVKKNGYHKQNNVKYTLDEVLKHNSEDDCWIVENGSVYNITNFLKSHPGGAELILSKAGKDVTDLLQDEATHKHTANAYQLLKEYKIGDICKDEKKDDINNQESYPMKGWNEELVDWNKGMVFQVHRFGQDYLKWVHSPVNKQLKLFDSNFVEFFSKTPWYMIPIIWIPVILIVSVLSMHEIYDNICGETFAAKPLTVAVFCASFMAGLPMWSFLEYVLHRYLFHLEPKGGSAWMITLHFFLHGQHHKVPFDEMRLVFPPVCAAILAILLNSSLVTLIPWGVGRAMFAGGLLGYVVYDVLHYYLHYGTPQRGSYLHSLKYYHVLHHFDDYNTGYGISSKLWDYPFDTVNKKLEKKKKIN